MENPRPSPDSTSSPRPSPRPGDPLMLSPQNALRILRRRTGGNVSQPTFYRWLSSGRIVSIRVGFHIFIPWYALQEFIEKCLKGEMG